MKKSSTTIVVVIVIILLIVGGYFIFHKSNKTNPSSSSTNPQIGQTNSQPSTSSTSIIQTKNDATLGQYLANSNGKALYTYSGDTTGVSNCTGSCAAVWPPYAPSPNAPSSLPSNVTIITRSDNSKQYADKGKPLYSFTSDSTGQVSGNGVSGFSVAKP